MLKGDYFIFHCSIPESLIKLEKFSIFLGLLKTREASIKDKSLLYRRQANLFLKKEMMFKL